MQETILKNGRQYRSHPVYEARRKNTRITVENSRNLQCTMQKLLETNYLRKKENISLKSCNMIQVHKALEMKGKIHPYAQVLPHSTILTNLSTNAYKLKFGRQMPLLLLFIKYRLLGIYPLMPTRWQLCLTFIRRPVYSKRQRLYRPNSAFCRVLC